MKTNSKRKEAEKEHEKIMIEIQDVTTKIEKLHGLIPVCAGCKNIRDDQGCWRQIGSHLREHPDVEFTHSVCPICAKKLYPDLFE